MKKKSWCHPHSYFISFEGVEGSGKSTLINRLAQYFRKQNFNVVQLREPGGTEFGEKLRQVILEQTTPLTPLAEAHLFCASRAQLLAEKIIPALQTPQTIVFIDRFVDSSLAYQGVARGLTTKTILQIHQHYPLNTFPHLTFYLKISAAQSLERQKIRGGKKDYFEKEKVAFTKKLIKGFDFLAKKYPRRIKILKGEKTPDELFMQAKKQVERLVGDEGK